MPADIGSPPEKQPVPPAARTDRLWEFTRRVLEEYFWLLHCIRFRGIQNIPAQGPVIFAPNHVSYYDPPMIAVGIPFRIRFMAWDKLFQVPGFSRLIELYGAYPVRQKTVDKKAIATTLSVLRNGGAVIIFPEGERSSTGELSEFENGVARLAIQTQAFVVPVTVTGAFEAWPRFRLLPRWLRPIQVKFHPAILPAGAAHAGDVRTRMEELNQLIRQPIERRLRAYARCKLRKTLSNKPGKV